MSTITHRRSPHDSPDDRGPGWVERLLLSVMGPAQVGEDRAPEGYTPDPAVFLCPKCGRSWDDHERVHGSNVTYTVCPVQP